MMRKPWKTVFLLLVVLMVGVNPVASSTTVSAHIGRWPRNADLALAIGIVVDEPTSPYDLLKTSRLIKEGGAKGTYFVSGQAALIGSIQKQLVVLSKNGFEISALGYYYDPHRSLLNEKRYFEVKGLYADPPNLAAAVIPLGNNPPPETVYMPGVYRYPLHLHQLRVQDLARSYMVLKSFGVTPRGFAGPYDEETLRALRSDLPSRPGYSRFNAYEYTSGVIQAFEPFPVYVEATGRVDVPPTLLAELDAQHHQTEVQIVGRTSFHRNNVGTVEIKLRNMSDEFRESLLDVWLPSWASRIRANVPHRRLTTWGQFQHILLRPRLGPNETRVVRVTYKGPELVGRVYRFDLGSGSIQYPLRIWRPIVALETWEEQIDRIAEKGGMVTFRGHINTISSFSTLLQEIIKYTRGKGMVWDATYGEIASWWLKRQKISVERVVSYTEDGLVFVNVEILNRNPEMVRDVPLEVVLPITARQIVSPEPRYRVVETEQKKVVLFTLDLPPGVTTLSLSYLGD